MNQIKKYEWRKEEKNLYLPKGEPEEVLVPASSYLCIDGTGNPNERDFSERVSVLYSLSYAIKMMPKSGFIPEGYYDYTVFPLEGIWTSKNTDKNQPLDKSQLVYTIQVKQPNFVTQELFDRALTMTKSKKPHPYLEQVKFVTYSQQLCVQMMHTGSYDSEPEDFEKMNQYLIAHNQTRTDEAHHIELYIKPKKDGMSEADLLKLKTVLRYPVRCFEMPTPCGEFCNNCKHRIEGSCKGCRSTDGSCIKMWEHGCDIYQCSKKHHAAFCGLCSEFPCDWLESMIKQWNPNGIENLQKLAQEYRERKETQNG